MIFSLGMAQAPTLSRAHDGDYFSISHYGGHMVLYEGLHTNCILPRIPIILQYHSLIKLVYDHSLNMSYLTLQPPIPSRSL